VKGSFTGAFRDKRGKIQLAHRGILFLDEVGEMSLRMQALLLRFLENGEIQAVGSDQPQTHVDVRVLAATNRNLVELVAAGQFREDLYYRLCVIHLRVPALRERPEDIRALMDRFLARTDRSLTLTDAAVRAFLTYRWPGNVRELLNVLEQLVWLSTTGIVDVQHLPPALQAAHPAPMSEGLFRAVETYEHELILEALGATRGNRNQAARLLKVSERVLSYKIKKYRIDCNSLRDA